MFCVRGAALGDGRLGHRDDPPVQAWLGGGAASGGTWPGAARSCSASWQRVPPRRHGPRAVLKGCRQAGHAAERRDRHVDDAYLRESILNPQAKIVAGFQPAMPTFQGLVTEEQLLQLIAYVKSLGDQN